MRQADGALAGARNFAVFHACPVGAVRGDDRGTPVPDAHDVEAAARAHRYVARLARERKALDDLAVYDDFNLRRIERAVIDARSAQSASPAAVASAAARSSRFIRRLL